MGRENKWIKNIGRNFSIKSIQKYFYNIKASPTIKQKYEKIRYFNKKKILKYDKNNQIHDIAINKIYNTPSIIGINDVFYNAEMEVDFFDKNIQKGSVDLLIETKNHIYAIEYKSRHTDNNRRHAKLQLKKAKHFIKKNFGTDITKLLYIYGDFETEVLERIAPY